MYQFIAIEGNIGAGKTTLSKSLAAALGAQLILEEFAENPFLPKFYKEPEKHAFALELSFMAARFQQINQLIANRDLFTNSIVSDYIFLKSQLFASVTLKEDEFTLFKSLFSIINNNLPQPDLLLFLNTPIPQLLLNIKERGRPYEQEIQADYLYMLNEVYLSFLKQITHMPVLIIESKEKAFPALPDILDLLNQSHPPGIQYISK
jgi:deoxyguanosine kinase